MKAIIIDDSGAMRALIHLMLDKVGFEVLEAGDGREGLEQPESNGRQDLALVDWNRPAVTGEQFVVAAHARPTLAAMRIVIVTSETSSDELGRALAAGPDEYVMKSFNEEALQSKLVLLGLAET